MNFDIVKTYKYLGCTLEQRRTLSAQGFSRRDSSGYTDLNGNRIARYKKTSGVGTAFYYTAIKYCGFTGKPIGSESVFYASLDELIAGELK